MLTVNVLGPLSILVDGRPLIHAPKKGKALLAYLAIVREPVSRERLADLLWPYQGSEQARHSLRNCLLDVRKHLGASREMLRSDFTSCWLQAETDLQRFLDLARSGSRAALGAAGKLVRGELMDDFVVNSEPWCEWCDGERERVRELLNRALTKYSEASTAAGQQEEAIEAARRLVKLDNLHEPAHRCLMRALAAAGWRSAALQQYKKLQKILQDELGVTPDAASRELAEELAQSEREPEPVPTAPEPVPPLRLVLPAAPAASQALRSQLQKLAIQVEAWRTGAGRLTRGLVEELGQAVVDADQRIGELEDRLAEVAASAWPPDPIRPDAEYAAG